VAVPQGALQSMLLGCVREPDQVRISELDRRALSHDASHFLLVPQAIVAPRDADEVAKLLRATASAGIDLTFRSGGTSLSGQAGTEGVLADVRKHFTGVEVLDDGRRVRVEPGVTVRQLNAHLAPYGRKFGPDPASEAACTIGGVVANNSSGMACGTVENSYRTLESVVAVLPSGTVIDTGAPDADQRLRALEPELHAGLLKLRERIIANPASRAKVTSQFAMKNTMGYGLNALVDFDDVPQILTHVIVGSEGTLAFIASATFATVEMRSHSATALLVFDDLYAANASLPALVSTGAATLELMDATSLRVGQRLVDSPAFITELSIGSQAALLLEYQASSAAELEQLANAATPTLDQLPVGGPVRLTTDEAVRGTLWKLRKGLYTSVAGARRSGSTALLEDVVVPVAKLADTCADLTGLFDRHGYEDSVIFGHAKDGNIHFMITDRFENDDQLGRYRAFTEDLVSLILANDGSLKAEHGTGRVMAPYVRRQYGDELYEVMVALKDLFDPGRRLGSGTIITDDPHLHLKHIKVAPQIDEDVDRCVECGYCEPVCPSRNLTLTPRQRIGLRRDIRDAEVHGDQRLAAELERDYAYAGVDTCAVDGLCVTACPVQINTGTLVKRLRGEQLAKPKDVVWTTLAKHWQGTTATFSTVMGLTAALPPVLAGALIGVNKAGRAILGTDNIPLWSPELPGGGAPRRRPAPTGEPAAVYLPACVNVMFGPTEGPGVQVSFEALCAQAGVVLLVPPEIESLCCGTPWSSKGIADGYAAMKATALPAILAATDNGRLPVVCDASSCTEGYAKLLADLPESKITVIDAVAFVAQYVLPALGQYQKLDSVTVHPTCSSTQLGLNADLVTVAGAVAETVNVPLEAGCCAFAGDRGMLHPELTAAATAPEAVEVAALAAAAHASCNRTCELGMTRATGKEYRHVLELLAERAGALSVPQISVGALTGGFTPAQRNR
jgi:D-lactate dehydrogenase